MSRHRRQQRKRARNFVGELPSFCFPARARETISDAERAMGEPPAQWIGITYEPGATLVYGWVDEEPMGTVTVTAVEPPFAMREAEREDS